MPSTAIGHIKNGFYTLGLCWSAVYLLDSDRPALFESGFSCAASLYEQGIRSVLGARPPEFLFLTHVHWDHCGSAAYLKQVFPSLQIAASTRAAEIIKRPHAQDLMRRLSRNVIPLVETFPGVDKSQLTHEPFQPFEVDFQLEDGQVIDIGKDLSVHVLATPGHTRDHLSYYIPEKRVLIATEASGCLDRTGRIITEFLVDFDAYLSSLKRIAALPVDVLVQGHHFIFLDDEVEPFLAQSISAAERHRDHVCELLASKNGAVEDVVRQIKAEEWDSNPGIKQPKDAYLLNLTAQVTHFAEKMKGNGSV